MYTDPDGEAWWLIPVIVAGIFAAGNTAAHAIRGETGFWNFTKAFVQGAVTGFALGCGYYFAGQLAGAGGFLSYIGKGTQTVMKIYAGTQLAIGGAGIIAGGINNGFTGMSNAAKIFLGNFYLDENNFFRGMLQGFTRHTWEMLQQTAGQAYTQFVTKDAVEYFGGATYVIKGNKKGSSVSLGSFLNIKFKDRYNRNDFLTDGKFIPINNQLFMHEYGHMFQSQWFGFLYLFAIGIPSAAGAQYTEKVANRQAARYFNKYYDVVWDDERYPR